MEFNDNSIIICPSQIKMKILDSKIEDSNLSNIKFMNKKEYIDNYFFAYDESALYYLMNKYKYKLDVAKVYLKNLYVIDLDKKYINSKLVFLQNLKKELISKNLLKINTIFRNYIKNKTIYTINYYDLDKFEELALNTKIEIPKVSFQGDVVECETIEEEVNYVCLKILELLKQGIDINKIFLTNINNDYYYIINKLFKYYNIPINLNNKDSIYSTKVVRDYLKDETLDLESKTKSNINRKLINVIASLSKLDKSTDIYKTILIDKLKHTYTSEKVMTNAINIKDLYKDNFEDDEYVFVLGFNQDILPKMEKDISFINDSIKNEVDMYETPYINKRNKDTLIYLLSNIKNVYLSYKLSTPFSSFYKSSIITDLKLNVIKPSIDKYNKSPIYNKIRLAEKLDLYNLYGEKDDTLKLLYSNYKIPYNTYSNEFTGINNELFINTIKNLKLSYTSINSYNECAFKYYIKYILKLDIYESTFPAFIGSLYHNILSLYRNTNFDFEKEYNEYLQKRELSLKEKMLLIKIKKDLLKLIAVLKKQQLITGYDESICERKIDVELDKKIPVIFTGAIDKIMYYQKLEDTYFSIVDYKTGTIDTHIEPMKYGLHLQLPVYLYLIKNSRIFKNPIFTGIYYQNILFNYPTWDGKKDTEEIYNENLRLQGYSTNDTELLERFDTTYEKSEYIKSMSFKEEKGFGTYTKVIDDSTLNAMLDYTSNEISNKTDQIIESNFPINPKVYAGKNIACEFCKYKDLCYMKENDQVYLNKVDDLSFLGGDL